MLMGCLTPTVNGKRTKQRFVLNSNVVSLTGSMRMPSPVGYET